MRVYLPLICTLLLLAFVGAVSTRYIDPDDPRFSYGTVIQNDTTSTTSGSTGGVTSNISGWGITATPSTGDSNISINVAQLSEQFAQLIGETNFYGTKIFWNSAGTTQMFTICDDTCSGNNWGIEATSNLTVPALNVNGGTDEAAYLTAGDAYYSNDTNADSVYARNDMNAIFINATVYCYASIHNYCDRNSTYSKGALIYKGFG